MSEFLNIPLLSSLKVYKNTSTPGIHFDDDWAYNQIKSFEAKVGYKYKWQRGDHPPLQVWATGTPGNIKVYDVNQVLKKTIVFTSAASGGSLGYDIYEATLDIDDLADGYYYFYSTSTFGGSTFEFISEPVYLLDTHPGTLLFKYWNTENVQDVIFSTGIKYLFRCEAGIMDFQPDHDRASYIDQIHNVSTLSGVPFRTYKLNIGDAKGVAPYIIDILNRIFCCDRVVISEDGTNGKRYETTEGAKWEVNRVKGYPLFGGSIEVIEALNRASLQLNDQDTDEQVTVFVQTGFFESGIDALITETEGT